MKTIFHDCSCKPNEPYADGSLPEFFTKKEEDLARARAAWLLHLRAKHLDPLYWGIHLEGKHIVNIVPESVQRSATLAMGVHARV